MKVLFVSSGNSQFGIVTFIHSQGESIKKEGVELDYFTIVGTGVLGYMRNIPILRKKIRQGKYDIIHAHYSLVGLLVLLTLTGKPVVISLMGSDTYGDYNEKGKRTLKSLIPMLITQFIQPFVKAIIVKSKNIEKYIYALQKTHVIANGVDFQAFRPMKKNYCKEKLNFPEDKKIVLSLVNPEDPRKNFQLIKEAFKQIESDNLLLINPFPAVKEDIPYYINAADVLVLTSYNEGSPNIIKEAMACNCPIVSTEVGDVKEVIAGTEGCFLTGYDKIEVKNKILKSLEINTRTNGRSNIEHLESGYVAKKIIKIYQNILH